MAQLAHLVGEITRRGHTAILDPHNYAKRRIAADGWANEHVIGSIAVPIRAFEDFWRRLASAFKSNDRVVFGLMNEPYGLSAAAWLEIANRAIAAIRGSGAGNLMTVPGTNYTGAHSWLSSGNDIFANVSDPANRFAIEVHQYFDDNSSGTSPEATSGTCGSDRLRAFQKWARANKLKAFLGEFGAADNPAALNALADICQEMSANPDVWLGWTAWSAGPFWPPDYMFNLGPAPDGSLQRANADLVGLRRAHHPGVLDVAGSGVRFRPGARTLLRVRRHGDRAGLRRSPESADEPAGRHACPRPFAGVAAVTGVYAARRDRELREYGCRR